MAKHKPEELRKALEVAGRAFIAGGKAQESCRG